jgi:hypothetical protein
MFFKNGLIFPKSYAPVKVSTEPQPFNFRPCLKNWNGQSSKTGMIPYFLLHLKPTHMTTLVIALFIAGLTMFIAGLRIGIKAMRG